MEWQSSGSLLLARESVEAEPLQARQERLRGAGIAAQYLDEGTLHAEEPALHSSMAGGLLVSSDSQLVRAMLLKASDQRPGLTASDSAQSPCGVPRLGRACMQACHLRSRIRSMRQEASCTRPILQA